MVEVSNVRKSRLSRNRLLRCVYTWVVQLVDPVRVFNGLRGFAWFFPDWCAYSRLPGAEPIRLLETWPQVHDRTDTTVIDAHYFYANGWAARRIVSSHPVHHVDVGSQTMFANLLGATIPVTFLDFRPLSAKLPGLQGVAGTILQMPFTDTSISSLSCLHVAEHIGLGRYGDPLDPHGTIKAAREISRVLAEGGNLYFSVPVGRERLRFNGCRIHAAETVCGYFSDLDLIEFSGVHDDGRFVEQEELEEFNHSDYACGMFWFKKNQRY